MVVYRFQFNLKVIPVLDEGYVSGFLAHYNASVAMFIKYMLCTVVCTYSAALCGVVYVHNTCITRS